MYRLCPRIANLAAEEAGGAALEAGKVIGEETVAMSKDAAKEAKQLAMDAKDLGPVLMEAGKAGVKDAGRAMVEGAALTKEGLAEAGDIAADTLVDAGHVGAGIVGR